MFDINFINLFNSIIVTLTFLYVYVPLIWMIIYEYKYYKGAGDDYLHYGKDYVKEQYKKLSNGNKCNKK